MEIWAAVLLSMQYCMIAPIHFIDREKKRDDANSKACTVKNVPNNTTKTEFLMWVLPFMCYVQLTINFINWFNSLDRE